LRTPCCVDPQTCKEQQSNIEEQSPKIVTSLYCSVLGEEVTHFSCLLFVSILIYALGTSPSRKGTVISTYFRSNGCFCLV